MSGKIAGFRCRMPVVPKPHRTHLPDLKNAVRESGNKSAASAASLDYVKFQGVIKSAASTASLHEGRVSGQLDHDVFFLYFLAALAPKK